jgi:hypothetical protein
MKGSSEPSAWRMLGRLALALFLLHFSLGPNDFVLDDWTNLKDYGARPWGEILAKATTHPTRPVSLFCVMAGFRIFGDLPTAFFLLSFALQMGFIALCLGLATELGLSRASAFGVGLCFLAWPVLSENIRWPTMVVGASACALPAYLAALWGFVRHIRTGSRVSLLVGGAAYLLAVFSYESGIFLPVAALALWTRENRRRVLRAGLVCATVLGAYATWRLTNAFGRGTAFLLAGHFQPDWQWRTLLWNAAESLRLLLAAFREPLNPPPSLLLPAAGLAAGFGWYWRRHRRPPDEEEIPPRLTAFALLWFLAGLAPILVSYAAGRLLYLPLVGLSLGLAPWFNRAARRPGGAAVLAAASAVMVWIHLVAQRDWRISGQVQRALRQELIAGNSAWRAEGRAVILVRTGPESAPSAFTRPPGYPYRLGQAGFLRGFALENLAFGIADPLPVVLDVECGLRKELTPAAAGGARYHWHRRFDPSQTHHAPAAEAVELDIPPRLSAAAQ